MEFSYRSVAAKWTAVLATVVALSACGGGSDDAAPLAFAMPTTTTTTTTTVPANADAVGAQIDLTSSTAAGRCGIADPQVGEVELLPGDYLAVVSPAGLIDEAAFDRMSDVDAPMDERIVVCLDDAPADATRGCGVQNREGDEFTLHLSPVTVLPTVIGHGPDPLVRQSLPMYLFAECPGDPNDSNPTLFPTAASGDIRVEPTEVDNSQMSALIETLVLDFGLADRGAAFSSAQCESLAVTVERANVLHDEIRAFLGSQTTLFPSSIDEPGDPVEAAELQATIDWFGEASSISLSRFEGHALRELLAGLHLNQILWNDVAEAVAERQEPVDPALRAAWLHWRLGNALRLSSIVHADAVTDHLQQQFDSSCEETELAASAEDTTEVCALLAPIYERRSIVRANTLDNNGGGAFYLADLLDPLNERFPPALNPYFDASGIAGLWVVEYNLEDQLLRNHPMDRVEIAEYEAGLTEVHAFTEANCTEIDPTTIHLPSALDVAPAASSAETAEHRVGFCSTLAEFFDQRSTFRSGISTGKPVGFFPAEQRDAWDAMRNLTQSLQDQLDEHGAAIEPSSDSPIHYAVEELIGVENQLRQYVFAEYPQRIDIDAYQEDRAAAFETWAQTACLSPGLEPVPPLSSYDLPRATDLWLDFGSTLDDLEAAFCPRLSDALPAKLQAHHQMANDDLSDPNRLSDLRLVASRLNARTVTLEQPFGLVAGLEDADAWSLTDGFTITFAVMWDIQDNNAIANEYLLSLLDHEQQFTDVAAAACPDLADDLRSSTGEILELAEQARIVAHSIPVYAVNTAVELTVPSNGSVWSFTLGPLEDVTDEVLAGGVSQEYDDGVFVAYSLSATLISAPEYPSRLPYDVYLVVDVDGSNFYDAFGGCWLDDEFAQAVSADAGETITGRVCVEIEAQHLPAAAPGLDVDWERFRFN